MTHPDIRPLVRLVHLVLRAECVADFLALLDRVGPQIRSMPGCLGLEIWRDLDQPERFVTMSRWLDGAALENYRTSALFRATWTKVKPWFLERARASSYEAMEDPSARPISTS